MGRPWTGRGRAVDGPWTGPWTGLWTGPWRFRWVVRGGAGRAASAPGHAQAESRARPTGPCRAGACIPGPCSSVHLSCPRPLRRPQGCPAEEGKRHGDHAGPPASLGRGRVLLTCSRGKSPAGPDFGGRGVCPHPGTGPVQMMQITALGVSQAGPQGAVMSRTPPSPAVGWAAPPKPPVLGSEGVQPRTGNRGCRGCRGVKEASPPDCGSSRQDTSSQTEPLPQPTQGTQGASTQEKVFLPVRRERQASHQTLPPHTARSW